jgi:hypothetical protein
MQGVRLLNGPLITHEIVEPFDNDCIETRCGRLLWTKTIGGVIDATGKRVQHEVDCMACIAAGTPT